MSSPVGKAKTLFRLMRYLDRIPVIEQHLNEIRQRLRIQADNVVSVAPAAGLRRDSVDLIRYGRFGVFAFENDQLYDLWDASAKHQAIEDFMPAAGVRSPDARVDSSLVASLAKALSGVSNNLTVLDIGAHWGLVSLDAIDSLQSRSAPWRIVCFEPGPTADLIEATIALNGLGSHLSVRKIGVLDRNGPGLFYQADGSTNANAFKRHIHHQYASLCWSVDIRDLLAEFESSDAFFIKMDIEGLEPALVKAIAPAFSEKPIGMCLEFAYGPPAEELLAHLQFLDRTHAILDARSNAHIPRAQFSSFIGSLIDMPARYTDIVCVPKRDDLLDKFPQIDKSAL